MLRSTVRTCETGPYYPAGGRNGDPETRWEVLVVVQGAKWRCRVDPAEVLAVEIKQYVGQGLAALVPRVIGQTVAAKDTKGIASLKSPRGSWDETSFLTSLTERSGSEAAMVARHSLPGLLRDSCVFCGAKVRRMVAFT